MSTTATHGPIDAESWTVSDGPNLPREAHCIMLESAGAVQVRFTNGNTVTFPNLAAGIWHPMQIDQIIDGGTDPTALIIGYLEPKS